MIIIEDTKEKKPNQLINIMITQAICIAAILLIIIGVKYFFKQTYSHLKVWYGQEICDDTDINEVLDTKVGDIDEV